MSQLLISLSPDLKQLRDEGFEIQIRGGYILTTNIPYVNSKKEIKYGTLVSELNLRSNTQTTRPNTHVIFFIGEHPCNKDGSVIQAISHNSQNRTLGDGIIVNHSFSNKPPNGYEDYYKKISRYAEIITAPAKSIDKNVTEKTFKAIPDDNLESPFHYIDTNSSRAKINQLNSKFSNERVGIIGLGGTGAYILDLVSKTPVQSIELFDGDSFLQHNAFRSPGAVPISTLEKQYKKAEYYAEVYSNLHRNIKANPTFVSSNNIETLKNLSFIFLCIDKNSIRREIIEYLLEQQIPFIDVGLGVNLAEENLIGTIRVTTCTSDKNDHLQTRIPFEDDDNNEYNTNIQIADLNALNAALAVIKWKKLCGFYQDLKSENHSTYSLNVSQLLNNDFTA